MLNIRDYITVDNNILNGVPVFHGTRVPVESLFSHLEKGISIDVFLEDFPSVTQKQVISVLELAGSLFTSKSILKLYEAAA
jgi:uncharacterized protein (DUF433 family)